MSNRKKSIIWVSVLSVLLLLTVFAVKLADGTFSGGAQPTITASPDVTLVEPEPMISADSGAKVPSQPKPVIRTVPAPPAPAPTNIPSDVFVSTPQYVGPVAPAQPPVTTPQVPLPAPQQPPVAPITPLPQPVSPPRVTEPVEGILEPVTGTLKPITGIVNPIIKPLIPPVVPRIIDPLPLIPKILK